MENLESYTIEQLQKIKDNLKAKTNELRINKTSIIDKFTSIDELTIDNTIAIKQLIEEQRDTNRTLSVTNKLLLALYVKEDADGNYIANIPSEFDSVGLLEALEGGGEERTRIKTLPNEKIIGKKVVFTITGKGYLIELLLKSSTSSSNNKSYSLRILADNTNAYDGTFTEFEDRNHFEVDLTCYEDTRQEKYIMEIKNIMYEDSLVIEVYESVATFEQVYIKYHEVV